MDKKKKEKNSEDIENTVEKETVESSEKEVSSEEIENKQENDELKKLKDTIIELDGKLKYQQAELINYRKRKDEEVAGLLKLANKDLILELLPIADNFERAIKLDSQNENSEVGKFLAGFKILYTTLMNTFKKFGVEEIETVGKTFDPLLHEALMVQNNSEMKDEEIIECLLKGYTLNGKVIRPSKVIVNKLD